MAIVLKRLQDLWQSVDNVDFSLEREVLTSQSLSCRLSLDEHQDIKHGFFNVLVDEDASLVLEYNAFRALLGHAFTIPDIDVDSLTSLVQEGLDLAEALDKKYSLYVNDRPNFRKKLLKADLSKYRQWLLTAGHLVVVHPITEPRSLFLDLTTDWFYGRHRFHPYIDSWLQWMSTENMNPNRLHFLRIERFLVRLIPMINNSEYYGNWVSWMDGFASPLFRYIAVIFFLPRLTYNTILFWSHVFEHQEMSEEERSLGMFTRFFVQFDRLWPNLTNDIAWVINGIVICFVLVGSLQPMAIYFSVGMQFYDLALACIRAHWEFSRLNKLEQYYVDQSSVSVDPLLSQYVLFLKQSIVREKFLLRLSVANFLVLFAAIITAIPTVIVFNPLLPVVGAFMAVVITFVNFQGRHYLAPKGPVGFTFLPDIEVPERPLTPTDSLISSGDNSPSNDGALSDSSSTTHLTSSSQSSLSSYGFFPLQISCSDTNLTRVRSVSCVLPTANTSFDSGYSL